MPKFLEYLLEAEKITKTIDHMFYITFPLIKDKRLLIKIIKESKMAIANCINAILQYEYLYKRISLYKDAKSNLQTFIKKCAKKYNITEQEINQILNLFEIIEAHKQSAMTFLKEDKVVILSKNMQKEVLSVDKTKEFLSLTKNILIKTKNHINPKN